MVFGPVVNCIVYIPIRDFILNNLYREQFADSCAADCQCQFYKCMHIWRNRVPCCVADICWMFDKLRIFSIPCLQLNIKWLWCNECAITSDNLEIFSGVFWWCDWCHHLNKQLHWATSQVEDTHSKSVFSGKYHQQLHFHDRTPFARRDVPLY